MMHAVWTTTTSRERRWHSHWHLSWRFERDDRAAPAHSSLLRELDQELFVVLYFVLNVFSTFCMLLAAKGRRVLQVNSTILTEKVWHFY